MKLYEAVKNEKFIELVKNECKWIGDNQIEDRVGQLPTPKGAGLKAKV